MVFWGNEVILLLSLCYCWSSQPELPQVVALISLPWNKRTPNSSKSNSSNLSHKKGGSFPPFTQKHKHDRSANSAKDMLYNKCLPGDQTVRRAIVRLKLFLPLPCAWASQLNEGELLEIHVSHRVMYFAFYPSSGRAVLCSLPSGWSSGKCPASWKSSCKLLFMFKSLATWPSATSSVVPPLFCKRSCVPLWPVHIHTLYISQSFVLIYINELFSLLATDCFCSLFSFSFQFWISY